MSEETKTAVETTNETAPAEQVEQKKEPEKKYTDADVDRILNSKFAKWQAEQDKKIAEAERLAKMNEQERAEAERDALKKELDDLKHANNLAKMGREARKMLSDSGLTVSDDLLNTLVSDDAEATKAAVDAFTAMFKNAVETEVKRQLSGNVPTVGTTPAKLTKADIMAVEDKAERQKLIAENLELFQ